MINRSTTRFISRSIRSLKRKSGKSCKVAVEIMLLVVKIQVVVVRDNKNTIRRSPSGSS